VLLDEFVDRFGGKDHHANGKDDRGHHRIEGKNNVDAGDLGNTQR